jgi:tetratricopeptide (TPR) repeat protein
LGLITLECKKCGASLQVDESATQYICRYCQSIYQRENTNISSPTPTSLSIVAERAFSRGEFGKAMQFIEQGLAINPNDGGLLALEKKTRTQLDLLAKQQIDSIKEKQEEIKKQSEASQYALQANSILSLLQINLKVYKSNSGRFGSTPADVDLGLQYIDRALEYFPDNPSFLNLKSLLLWEGKKNKQIAVKLLEKAHAIDPRDITIANNLKVIRS